jgi:hypothetical protein
VLCFTPLCDLVLSRVDGKDLAGLRNVPILVVADDFHAVLLAVLTPAEKAHPHIIDLKEWLLLAISIYPVMLYIQFIWAFNPMGRDVVS